MGYFANGTEGELFREQFCYQCVNWGADALSRKSSSDGCPIMDVHVLHGYGASEDMKTILDQLIERHEIKDVAPNRPVAQGANRCLMFHRKPVVAEQSRPARSVLPGTSAMAPWPMNKRTPS